MPIPEFFKYDIRVRERMLKRGELSASELSKHVDALADVTDQVVEVELKQPALVKESERVERVVSRSAPRPVMAYVPVVRSLENELNDIDDDEDDEDEDDVKVKAAAKVAAEKAKAEAAPAPAPAPESESESVAEEATKPEPTDEAGGTDT
ncbi:MAG: hypothetical protein ABI488_10630 [Polyangiaceae bacterium]